MLVILSKFPKFDLIGFVVIHTDIFTHFFRKKYYIYDLKKLEISKTIVNFRSPDIFYPANV